MRDLVGGRRDAARDERGAKTRRELDRLQVVEAVIGSERALFERAIEAEQLFAVIGQLGLDERAKVAVTTIGGGSRRQGERGQADDQDAGTHERCTHAVFLLTPAAVTAIGTGDGHTRRQRACNGRVKSAFRDLPDRVFLS
jgi:hypothetical protein